MRAPLAYCTNVHAGADLETTRANLEQHAVAVKQAFSPQATMGIGLWLSAAVAQAIHGNSQTTKLAGWLQEQGLLPYTFNGFPYGDFHQPVVKHRVYEPTWLESSRADYTIQLIEILDQLLPPQMEGSISTLPIAWGVPALTDEQCRQAAKELLRVAERLDRLENETGRLIYICIEPEPGCVFGRSADIVNFFQRYLFADAAAERAKRYLRVCHDVCHASVMFEPQREVIAAYQNAGIGIGKVQVSSAVRLDFSEMDNTTVEDSLHQLSGFAEDRYLHQTMTLNEDGTHTFYEDLPPVLQQLQSGQLTVRELRVHFHVPIYLESFGALQTTRHDIEECLQTCRQISSLRHYEVETYAWGVLPAALQQDKLATGISQELEWLEQAFEA